MSSFSLAAHAMLAAVWIFVCISLASRGYFVHTYSVVALTPSYYEPLTANTSALLFSVGFAILWMMLVFRANPRTSETESHKKDALTNPAILFALASALPLVLIIARGFKPTLPASYFEVLWFVLFSGWSCFKLAERVKNPQGLSSRVGLAIVSCLVLLVSALWYLDSVRLFNDFMLGFNDFGHFTQRIANTAAGRGLLRESPVLPAFWDHFNPGLLVLVPIWKLWPSAHMIFAVQAIALTSPAWAIYLLTKHFGASPSSRVLWSMAWLAQPVVGQFNLAYTYGWHPISLAIAPLLFCFWAILARRFWLAASLAVFAMSMEEGVIVVLACLAFALALTNNPFPMINQRKSIALAITLVLTFVAVFRFSGLAEFQTGRFHKLGANLIEIALSPVLRPSEFWGQVFRPRKAAFLLSLLLPMNLFAVCRGWRIAIAATVPLLVLVIWDHAPAASIAFQYTSAVLPVLWLAALLGTKKYCERLDAAKRIAEPIDTMQNDIIRNDTLQSDTLQNDATQSEGADRDQFFAPAMGALSCGALLSLFVGALPYSLDSLIDVKGRTYHDAQADFSGSIPEFNREPWSQRAAASEAGQWLHGQLEEIRNDGGEVLATTRIAAHLVGNRDVETVGQYLERRPQLAQLADRKDEPLRAYQWIVLDQIEQFQQSIAQTQIVEAEARRLGFQVHQQKYDIIIFRRPAGLGPTADLVPTGELAPTANR